MIAYQTQLASIHSSALTPLALIAAGESSRLNPPTAESKRRITTVYLEGILEPGYLSLFRQQLLAALADDSIEQVVIRADSPGGFTSGTNETAEIVRRLAKKKTVTVVAENYFCSAAYHCLSGATKIIASPSTIVGSLGVVVILVDDSRAFETAGLRAIPISTGPAKHLGVPGVSVSEDDILRVERHITDIKNLFTKDLRLAGRMTASQRESAFETGDAWIASQAKKRGLVDKVQLAEDALAEIFDSAPETHENLFGNDALNKYRSLVCQSAGIDEWLDVDADDCAVAKVEKQFPELAASALEHESRMRRY